MKAAIYSKYGSADVLTVKEIERPEPKKKEVLVKVEACSLNPRDATIRNGEFKWLSGRKFPMLTCADFSGTVVSVGEGVKDIQLGDGVFGYMQSVQKGCSAEYVAVPQEWIAKKPKSIPHAVAAAIPCTYQTALQALRNKAKIKEGSKLLIYGASGGVGTAAMQLAKYFKAHVTAICSIANREYCKAQGADEVWCYDEENISHRDVQFDIIFQIFSKDGLLFSQMDKFLDRKGTYLTLIPSPAIFLNSLLNKIKSKPALHPVLVKSNKDDLAFLAFLLKEEKIMPHISEFFELHDMEEAHRMIEAGHTKGKIVITLE